MITFSLLAAMALGAPDEADQQRFWNEWNSKYRNSTAVSHLDVPTIRRQDTALAWIAELGLNNPVILDLGCSTGWLSIQLSRFGRVVGTDISDASISEARQRYPNIEFECANFMEPDDRKELFDIVVAVDVMSCVSDQSAFIERIRQLLRPGGYVYIATPNRFVYERRDDVAAQGSGQVRMWNYTREVVALLEPGFIIRHITTLVPAGHGGILRAVNSYKLNALVGKLVSPTLIEGAKERLGLGQSIAVMAQRRNEPTNSADSRVTKREQS
ncbi:MAG TPA: class I SAM-dependent methyltransferase [Gemmatimonadaceae bacterium]|nr:class I SAM-dependent methyltransferase [Gemmatimonadaceae bacterium]